jgi:uncharacterized membrane protein
VVFLILGVLIWSGVHLIPSLGAKMRARWIERMGEGPYKGLFALSLVGALVLMVVGWRSAAPVALYVAPTTGGLLTSAAMFVSLVLFLGSSVPTNLKRFVRHPQLTGVAVWALAHLLANGDVRSLVLFGGLGLWAVVAMVCINRRDGDWQKPAPLPLSAEIKPLVAGIVGFALFAFLHPYISGVSALPIR